MRPRVCPCDVSAGQGSRSGRELIRVRRFEMREVREAIAHAAEGGQALHVFRWTAPPTAPAAFRQQERTEMAHLLDQDTERLVSTAFRLGIPLPRVQRRGTVRQHVDLCGQPLDRAKVEATPHLPASEAP